MIFPESFIQYSYDLKFTMYFSTYFSTTLMMKNPYEIHPTHRLTEPTEKANMNPTFWPNTIDHNRPYIYI